MRIEWIESKGLIIYAWIFSVHFPSLMHIQIFHCTYDVFTPKFLMAITWHGM